MVFYLLFKCVPVYRTGIEQDRAYRFFNALQFLGSQGILKILIGNKTFFYKGITKPAFIIRAGINDLTQGEDKPPCAFLPHYGQGP